MNCSTSNWHVTHDSSSCFFYFFVCHLHELHVELVDIFLGHLLEQTVQILPNTCILHWCFILPLFHNFWNTFGYIDNRLRYWIASFLRLQMRKQSFGDDITTTKHDKEHLLYIRIIRSWFTHRIRSEWRIHRIIMISVQRIRCHWIQVAQRFRSGTWKKINNKTAILESQWAHLHYCVYCAICVC